MTVARLLCDGKSQKAIAVELRKTEPAISLLKADALHCGILKLTYHPPRSSELEERLAAKLSRFHMRDIVVCASDVGSAAARYYENIVESDGTLVLDGGLTVSRFVTALRWMKLPGVLKVIPLCADPPSYAVSAYECMTRLATMFPGRIFCEKLPHLMSRHLGSDHRRIRRLASKAQVVVLGCGPWKAGFTASEFLRNLGFAPQEVRAKYPKIACLCGYSALDNNARHIRLPAVERVMPRAIDFEGIQKLVRSETCHVLLLAETATKAPAVMTSLLAGMANVLIVDEALAAALLELEDDASAPE